MFDYGLEGNFCTVSIYIRFSCMKNPRELYVIGMTISRSPKGMAHIPLMNKKNKKLNMRPPYLNEQLQIE